MSYKIIGIATGAFDMFHIGHLNLFQNAKKHCDLLYAGVHSDASIRKNKNKEPVIPEADRLEIVRGCKYVDEAWIFEGYAVDESLIEFSIKNAGRICDLVFVGSDWQNTAQGEIWESVMNKYNVKIIWLPYTRNVSSTQIKSDVKQGK
ncbi:MAG: adenylyltransferase/cytidyltransferase family protein [Candidatus Adiutrix sp.]|jgi:glycerol-3-phosphate cytidylyltransferase|nr:adenylyltransferase/cytidyltransferase family protein [Candidatus Adiutrix sp.]